MSISVRFRDFWPTFSPTDNFFVSYLETLYDAVSVIEDANRPVDIEICSVFESNKTMIKRYSEAINRYVPQVFVRRYTPSNRGEVKLKLWYTGENIRPPLSNMDFRGFLSYDQDDFGNRNFYLPLWMLHLNWFNDGILDVRSGATIKKEELIRQRKVSHSPNKLACAFISNRHPYRMEVVELLRKVGVVDVYGSAVNKPVRYKIDVSSNYKYTIAFENDYFPGYVTEKLLDAYVIGTVPLYWGNPGISDLINRECYVNYANFASMHDFVDSISTLDYEKIYTEPLFNYLPSLSGFDSFMRSKLRDAGLS